MLALCGLHHVPIRKDPPSYLHEQGCVYRNEERVFRLGDCGVFCATNHHENSIPLVTRVWVASNPLNTDDKCTHHGTLATPYQSILKVGFALTKKVGWEGGWA